MSLVYTNSVNVVKKEIDALLNQDTKISAEYVKTYFLYTSDNKLLMSIEKRKKHFSGNVYSVRLHNVGFNKTIDLQPNWKVKNLYVMSKDFFEEKYSLKSVVHIEFTIQDAKKEVEDYTRFTNSKDYNINRLLCNLIYNLQRAKCPATVMEQIIYYFDVPNLKKEFPKQFDMLNHTNKLAEYKTQKGNTWFFTGQNCSLGFKPMGVKSQKIFDTVKIALKKQKQNVK